MAGLMLLLVAHAALAVPTPTPTPTPLRNPPTGLGKPAQAGPRGRSLAEVAKGVKLRFPATKPKVITNDDLRALAQGAELTTAAPAPEPAATGGEPGESERREAEKKAYWQSRYFAAQRELEKLEAEEKRLAAEVARLEREFYSRDDPVQRDQVIKPAWDEALASLREVQERLKTARSAPEEIANAARRDGALPGWFRERPPAGSPPFQSPQTTNEKY